MSRPHLRNLCLLALVSTVCCQLIIPKRPLGYVYNGGSSDAPINLDVHMGPLCPDSRDAFPTVKKVADEYGTTIFKLTLHMFPLPYHHQAYLTAIVSKRRDFHHPDRSSSSSSLLAIIIIVIVVVNFIINKVMIL